MQWLGTPMEWKLGSAMPVLPAAAPPLTGDAEPEPEPEPESGADIDACGAHNGWCTAGHASVDTEGVPTATARQALVVPLRRPTPSRPALWLPYARHTGRWRRSVDSTWDCMVKFAHTTKVRGAVGGGQQPAKVTVHCQSLRVCFE